MGAVWDFYDFYVVIFDVCYGWCVCDVFIFFIVLSVFYFIKIVIIVLFGLVFKVMFSLCVDVDFIVVARREGVVVCFCVFGVVFDDIVL